MDNINDVRNEMQSIEDDFIDAVNNYFSSIGIELDSQDIDELMTSINQALEEIRNHNHWHLYRNISPKMDICLVTEKRDSRALKMAGVYNI